jgi:hypothetical protein
VTGNTETAHLYHINGRPAHFVVATLGTEDENIHVLYTHKEIFQTQRHTQTKEKNNTYSKNRNTSKALLIPTPLIIIIELINKGILLLQPPSSSSSRPPHYHDIQRSGAPWTTSPPQRK